MTPSRDEQIAAIIQDLITAQHSNNTNALKLCEDAIGKLEGLSEKLRWRTWTPEFEKVIKTCEDIRRQTAEIIGHARNEDYHKVTIVAADLELTTGVLYDFVLDDNGQRLRESVNGPDDTPAQKQWEPDPDDLKPPGGSNG